MDSQNRYTLSEPNTSHTNPKHLEKNQSRIIANQNQVSVNQKSNIIHQKSNSGYQTSNTGNQVPIDNNPDSIPVVEEPRIQKKIIVLSIDGFPAYYLDDTSIMDSIPHLKEFFSRAQGGRVKTVNPSSTYPAHTSMITGVDPSLHGIYSNRPVDPFYLEGGAWFYYKEDRRVKSFLEFAHEKDLVTASIYWPVSVGNFSKWNIPQIWNRKTPGDAKLLRALSTPGFHAEMENKLGEPVLETTGDSAKIRTGIQAFLDKDPHLTLIYSTDLDTNHHKTGAYSGTALSVLKKTDSLVGELIQKTNLYSRDDLALVIVSDHGFITTKKICRPNRILMDMGYFRPKSKSWDFYFHTNAGIASLVANPNTKRGRKRFPNPAGLRRRISKVCKGAQFHYKGKVFRGLKKEMSSTAIGFLVANQSLFISSTYNGAYYSSDSGLHVHGYNKSNENMDTILYFYGKQEEKNRVYEKSENASIKDTFSIVCDWLELECRKGEKID